MQTVLRFQPIERRGIAAIGIHNSRGYTQENLPGHIDLSRSHLNKILIGPAVAEIPAAMKEAIAGVPVARKMKDPSHDLVMAECLLSASPEFFQAKGATEKWTKQSVKWLKSEFGDKLLSAVLHMDEQTPHIHAVIRVDEEKQRVHPVTKELMPAKKVLCYSDRFMDRKEVLTKARVEGRSHLDTKMGRFQTRYAESVSSLGLSRGRESARTQEKDLKHTTTQEWRDMQQLRKEVKQLKKEEKQLQNRAAAIGSELTELGAKKISMGDELAQMRGESVQVKKDLTQVRSELVQVQKERDALSEKLAAEKVSFAKSVEKLEQDAVAQVKDKLVEVDGLEKKLVDLRTKYGVGLKKTEAQKSELQGLEKNLTDKNAELKKTVAQIEKQSEALSKGRSEYSVLLKDANQMLTNFKAVQSRVDDLTSKTEFYADWQKHKAQQPVQQQVQQVQKEYTLEELLEEGRSAYNEIKKDLDIAERKQAELEEQEHRQNRSYHSQSR
jgi:predicted  nucleic acid-binding Zn-ribbon protein